MLDELIDRNVDLKRLRDEGYDVQVRGGLLVIDHVPYVTGLAKGTAYGMLVSELTLNGNQTQTPSSHQVWFCGGMPHDQYGRPLAALSLARSQNNLFEGVVSDFQFSSKPRPPDYYEDYYQKMMAYIHAISDHAVAVVPSMTAKVGYLSESEEEAGIFKYMDTASGRAGIGGIKQKLAMNRVAIVGLGGTGSYILDIVAKTPVKTISLFDGDQFRNHNAFRCPGASSKEKVEAGLSKVAYLEDIYSSMREGIEAQNVEITQDNLTLLDGHDFIFVCVDNSFVRGMIARHLISRDVPFIDVGMGLELIGEQGCVIGSCRVTLCTKDQSDHFEKYANAPVGIEDDIYGSNIQLAEMNMLNAALAVIKWKKFCGFYQDSYREHESVYELNTNQLSSSADLRSKSGSEE